MSADCNDLQLEPFCRTLFFLFVSWKCQNIFRVTLLPIPLFPLPPPCMPKRVLS